MAISSEMARYMSSGCCPLCGARILDALRTIFNGGLHVVLGDLLTASGLTATERVRLAPTSANVTFVEPDTLRCGYCRETWEIHNNLPPAPTSSSAVDVGGMFRLPRVQQGGVPSNVSPPVPATPQTLSPTQFRFTRLRANALIEVPARSVRKVMRNDSSTTVTGVEEFGWRVERTVTVEDRNATIKGGLARLTIAGFADLGGTLAKEVREMYSVTSQAELSRTTSVSTPVPPHSAIEVELTWKIVRLPGVGLFAGSAGALVEMPFTVDMDLAVEWHTRNV
ncbi:hypothetical protein [Streptomyces siamensis]|uniref:LDB19 N-terminal domain-containing protein n=1 Tax=Streptomyces siamensis TaxID=1274986 RepID=A0ABP9JKY3_9ACTN